MWEWSVGSLKACWERNISADGCSWLCSLYTFVLLKQPLVHAKLDTITASLRGSACLSHVLAWIWHHACKTNLRWLMHLQNALKNPKKTQVLAVLTKSGHLNISYQASKAVCLMCVCTVLPRWCMLTVPQRKSIRPSKILQPVSYMLSYKLAKQSKPSSDGEVFKDWMVEAANILCPDNK